MFTKKIRIILILMVVLSLLLPGCDVTESGNDIAPKTQSVVLTKENFSQYFSIEFYVVNYEEKPDMYTINCEYGVAECELKITKIAPCEISNINVDLSVSAGCGLDWDDWYGSDQNISVIIPYSGEVTKKVTFKSKVRYAINTLSSPSVYADIITVSGTVEVKSNI